MSHTPGPWAIGIETNDLDAQIIGYDGTHIATISADPLISNAQLVAAAPDLLHALRLMLREHDALQMALNRTDDRWPSATLARNLLNQLEIGQ